MAWVHERIFAGGGTHIPAAWEQFSSEMGIQTVIHLSNPAPIRFSGSPPARFLWLNVEQEEDTDHAVRALCGRFVLDALEGEGSVLLHSTQGFHRTRWIYVAYLICVGRQVRAALTLAEEKPWQAPYHTDRQRWSDFKTSLSELPSPAKES